MERFKYTFSYISLSKEVFDNKKKEVLKMGKVILKNAIVRKPGHLYYIDAKGNFCEAVMARGGRKKKAAKKATKKKAAKKTAKKRR